jgi:hypothetical protein
MFTHCKYKCNIQFYTTWRSSSLNTYNQNISDAAHLNGIYDTCQVLCKDKFLTNLKLYLPSLIHSEARMVLECRFKIHCQLDGPNRFTAAKLARVLVGPQLPWR